MATKPCEECELYHEIARPKKNGDGVIPTGKGHCLNRTIYAKDRPGKPVYPPKARVESLEYNLHKIVLVRAKAIVRECNAFKERKK